MAKLILTADDDADFLDIVGAKLKSKGFSVQTAANGALAVEKATKIKPDLILMDVQMPEKDGMEATADLHANEQTKNIPIIFLTNLGDASPAVATINKRFSEQIGAVDYFKKGGDLDLLVARINEILK